ncbi:hypothetical protein [Wenyingzhuangia sp. IMCC45467]
MQIREIDNEISKQISLLKNEIKDLKFKNIDFEFLLSESKEEYVAEKLNYPGIYLIEIFFDKEKITFENWVENFTCKWQDKTFFNRPQIRKKSIQNIKQNGNWIPFYIGKSKTIGKRVNEHLFMKNEKRTYALKLFDKDFLKNEKFRISTIKIKVENYDQILPYIESQMREKLNPIIGKQ